MIGKIITILPVKMGNGAEYIRLGFEMQDGSWAKTDLCPTFNNYRHWKSFLVIGNVLGGLEYRGRQTINADCRPNFLRHEEPPAPKPPPPPPPPDPQMSFL